MQQIINTVLKCIKWPLVLVMIVMFLPVLNADLHLFYQTIRTPLLIRFVFPIFCVFAVWFVIPGLNGSHFAIFEHEFTHMIVALLTFHRPKTLQIHPDKGGVFAFYGEGNWLITLAPYFLPIFPLLMMLLSTIWLQFGHTLPTLFVPALGVIFGYHLISNVTQIHSEQTDFKKAGWVFSVLFLPTANLLAIGLVWAFAANRWSGVTAWWSLVLRFTQEMLQNLF